MFNVWLPAVLEERKGKGDGAIQAALRDVVLYAVAGCPGSVVSSKLGKCLPQIGSWMIQTHLGRKKSLAICTLATGMATFIFIPVRSDLAVITSSMFISLTGTAMYAVLCECRPGPYPNRRWNDARNVRNEYTRDGMWNIGRSVAFRWCRCARGCWLSPQYGSNAPTGDHCRHVRDDCNMRASASAGPSEQGSSTPRPLAHVSTSTLYVSIIRIALRTICARHHPVSLEAARPTGMYMLAAQRTVTFTATDALIRV